MSNWSHNRINEVWNKGRIIPGENPNVKRKDACNAIITKSASGD
jgi:hypothetical protein